MANGCFLVHEVGTRNSVCLSCEPREMLKHRKIVRACARAMYSKGMDTVEAIRELVTLVAKLDKMAQVARLMAAAGEVKGVIEALKHEKAERQPGKKPPKNYVH